jgi:hypothetical protein
MDIDLIETVITLDGSYKVTLIDGSIYFVSTDPLNTDYKVVQAFILASN